MKPALVLLALIAGLQAAFVVIDAWRLDQRRRAIEGEMTQVFKTAFPKAQAIIDPPLQMQRNLDSMKRERGLSGGDDSRTQLAQLTAILQAVPAIVPQRVSVRAGNASIEAAVPDPQTQLTLKSRAALTPGVVFTVDAGKVVRLSMKAER